MNLEAAAVTRLRDYLLHDHSAADESLVSSPATIEAILRRIRPFAEIMYLVMATDGDVDAAERKTLLSALEVLCDKIVPPVQLETLLDEFRQGGGIEEEDRIQMAAARIGAEKQDREMAFLLAAAIAVADHRLEEVERTTMQWVREYLGISDRRMNELLAENLV
jgi:uncharacterized tellurite resistance protein B-like protein